LTLKVKRTNVLLGPSTMERLKEICKQFHPIHRISASDLVRFALYEVYGINFISVHTWGDSIRKELRFIKEKEKFKEKGVKNGRDDLHQG